MKAHTSLARVAGLAAVTVAAVALSACSSPAGDSASEVKLRFLANITPVLTEEYYEDLVAPYEEANPGVDVIIEKPSAENVADTLKQQLAAGHAPDLSVQPVVAMSDVYATVPDEEWATDTPLADDLKIDGRQWQVGSTVQVQSLVYYNKDAFEAAGITETPTSVEEYTEALKLLADAGYVGLDTAGEWVTGAQFSMLANPAVMQTNPNWYSDRNEGKVSFVDSGYADYLDVYASWIADGLVPADTNGIKYTDSIAAFTSGKAATYVMGNWMVPSIDEADVPFEVGVFAAPSFDGEPAPLIAGLGNSYAVLDSSKYKDQAFDLIKYLVTDEAAIQKQMSAEGNFRAGQVDPDASELQQAVAGLVDASPGFVVPGAGAGDNVAPEGFGAELNTKVQGLYLGETPESVAEALDAWWTDAVE